MDIFSFSNNQLYQFPNQVSSQEADNNKPCSLYNKEKWGHTQFSRCVVLLHPEWKNGAEHKGRVRIALPGGCLMGVWSFSTRAKSAQAHLHITTHPKEAHPKEEKALQADAVNKERGQGKEKESVNNIWEPHKVVIINLDFLF